MIGRIITKINSDYDMFLTPKISPLNNTKLNHVDNKQ